MHILGFANGSINGNSQTILKAALDAAQKATPAITTSWVHMPSVVVPRNPKALEGAPDVSVGTNPNMLAGSQQSNGVDDRKQLLEAILNADGYIFATAVYSHSPVGHLKAVLDHVVGPYTDVAFSDQVVQMQRQGDARFANMVVDPRIFKPRVAAFIAIGGSTTPDQFTLVLPTLHTLTYPLHAKVVDQVVFMGCGGPGSILARHGGAYLQRALLLGKNVASQLGKSFDDAVFLGDEPAGACSYCHLAKFELLNVSKNEIGCVTCGALGHLVVREDGAILPVWRQNCDVSSITWAGKMKHIADIQTNGKAEAEDVQSDGEFVNKVSYWRDLDIPRVKLPSQEKP